MSIQSEIDRIETEVGTQSGLINQIQTELENKFEIDISQSVSDTPLNNNTVNLQNTLSGVKNIVVPDGIEPQEYVWNQIPTLVKEYLDNVTYDPTDTTSSSIAQYAPATPNMENTWPIGQSVEVSSGILERNGFKQNVTAGNVTLYNDVPQEFTEYSVNNNGIISQTGSLKPTGFLRQIKSANAQNVRDLGGWTCDGGTIKYGRLFRGGEINANDRTVLVDQCGVKFELNLRGVTESAGRTSSVLGNDIGYAIAEGTNVWYSLTDTTTWKDILNVIINNGIYNIPTYFHCAAGADRTGTVACIIEAILGVSRSDIDKDYELTCFYTGTSADNEARRRNESEWQNLMNQINSLTVGTTFRDKVINWIASLGFTVDEINNFRNSLIDGTPDEITLDIGSFSITKTGENVVFDNTETNIVAYQPYILNITPEQGYFISSVIVRMGGVDITKTAFEGTFIPNGTLDITENGEYDVSNYEIANVNVVFAGNTVTKTLGNATSNNSQTTAISGQSFGAIITPDDGYGISSMAVKMGGTDITSSVLTLIEEG